MTGRPYCVKSEALRRDPWERLKELAQHIVDHDYCDLETVDALREVLREIDEGQS